jgi:hypothetical protein
MTLQSRTLIKAAVPDPLSHRWGVPCPNCVFSLGPFEVTAELFFADGKVNCKNCSSEVDLWQASVKFASISSPGSMTVASLGATQTHFAFDLKAGERKEIDLESFGVPKGATTLGLVFTPHGSCFPIAMHANNVLIRFLGPKMWVYGVPFGLGTDDGRVSGFVTWIRRELGTEGYQYMVDAMEAMSAKRYRYAVLSCHVAFELEVMSLVRTSLERHASKEKVEDFLVRELGVSNATNVVLPQVCGTAGIPLMPDEVRGALNRLRGLRNKIVHRGIPDEAVTEKVAAEMLYAAMFGFEYVRFARKRLFPTVSDER